MIRGLVTAIWLALLLGFFLATTARTQLLPRGRFELLSPPPLSRYDPRLLNVLTLGHRGLYDDFATIWTLQILMDERLARFRPEQVFDTIHTVSRLKPKVETFYMMSCFVLAIDFGRPDLCETISLDGLEAFPDSWRIPVTQGFLFAYQLDDPKNAALYYGLAASRPDAPEFLSKLARNLMKEHKLSGDELRATLDSLLGSKARSKFDSYLHQRSENDQNGGTLQ